MGRETHIGSLKRKELCGRLFYYDTVQPYKEIFTEDGAGPALDALRQALFVFIADEMNNPTNGNSSVSFLSNLISRFSRSAEPGLEKHPKLLETVTTAVQERGKEISCANCSSAILVANGEEIVGDKGCCMSSLRQMFEIAYEVAKIYYSKFTTHPLNSLPEVVFSTKHSRDMSDLHDLPIRYAITGSTEYCSLGEQYWSAVNLKMCIEDFDFDSYMAVPYILFHECIAHAFHGIVPSPHARKPSEPEDGFAEGWMDYVAFKIMEEVMYGKGPAKHLNSKVKFTDAHHHRSYNLYFSRVDLDIQHPYKPSKYAIHRKSGHNAASKVHRVLERLPESYKYTWDLFLQMSFDLNMLQSFEPIQRQQFVALLNNLAKPGGLDTPRHCEIVPIIRKYIKTQDIDTFIKEVLGLRELWLKKKRTSKTPRPNVVHLKLNGPKWGLSH
ncbi:MAG: hypothetical protein WCB68_20310 [Pyrinomonadaceae bacterium]